MYEAAAAYSLRMMYTAWMTPGMYLQKRMIT